ncbi:RICIN domain-containing protein, partial [Streptosporangium sp. NPDC048865]|uniref:RICIN domain-containing protein n=1 Tax=Streptosporangium sp. NPDC048865 TaxID=3155766 RepID=UPI00343737FC
ASTTTSPSTSTTATGPSPATTRSWSTTTPSTPTLTNRHSGLCLDNYNFGTAAGSEVRQWTCNGNNAQQWNVS